jgi:hypothetical protein
MLMYARAPGKEERIKAIQGTFHSFLASRNLGACLSFERAKRERLYK